MLKAIAGVGGLTVAPVDWSEKGSAVMLVQSDAFQTLSRNWKIHYHVIYKMSSAPKTSERLLSSKVSDMQLSFNAAIYPVNKSFLAFNNTSIEYFFASHDIHHNPNVVFG